MDDAADHAPIIDATRSGLVPRQKRLDRRPLHVAQPKFTRHHPSPPVRFGLNHSRLFNSTAQLGLKPRVCWDSSGVYHGGGEMDHGCKALVGFLGAQGDALELLELAEEILDQVTPFIHLLVDGERPCAAWML